jgi:hypothetical protein
MDRRTRRHAALDHLPRALYSGPPTPGELQTQRLQPARDWRLQRISDELLAGARVNSAAPKRKRIARDANQRGVCVPFETAFANAARIRVA